MDDTAPAGAFSQSRSAPSAAALVAHAARLLAETRARRPRVHALTNAAAQAFTANLLLAAGAIPSLTIAAEEAGHFARRADAVLVNPGHARRRAPRRHIFPRLRSPAAREAGRPIVLDPVFVEASPPRLAAACEPPRAGSGDRGGSTPASSRLWSGPRAGTPETASVFATEHGLTVALTGPTDVITDGARMLRVENGHPLMARVTAMGCAGSALVAAFAALEPDRVTAAAAALLVLGVAGEIAGARAAGPGSFPAAFLDALDALDEAALVSHARVS